MDSFLLGLAVVFILAAMLFATEAVHVMRGPKRRAKHTGPEGTHRFHDEDWLE